MITFEDVKRKYLQASDGIDECMEIVNRDNPLDTTNYAPWVHLPTLARWLYGSSQEFLKDFQSTARGFSGPTESQSGNISIWESVLPEKVYSFRNKLLMVFGTKDEELAEALSK